MEPGSICLIAALFIVLRLIPGGKFRRNALLVLSVIFVFFLQSPLPVRGFDFWLPLATLGLTLCAYAIISDRSALKTPEARSDLLLITVSILLLAALRFVSYDGILTASRPPQFLSVIAALVSWGLLVWLCSHISGKMAKLTAAIVIALLITLLLCLKTPYICLRLGSLARLSSGQSAENATSLDLRWFGFSYISFRLLSTLIDARKGRKITALAGDYLIYVCFPPALAAGPIDRLERFGKDLAAISDDRDVQAADWRCALERLAEGAFKKFILADSLARFALSSENYSQFSSQGWGWIALLAYALQLYFDFSGYSDMAIGLGRLIGVRLPENFNRPYLKADIAKFWANWHITLTQWIRTYAFNPLTRSLRSKKSLPQWVIILLSQMLTMLLIGLWHGVSYNYLIWGLWHGAGLFVHQLYNQHSAPLLRSWEKEHPLLKKSYTLCSTIISDLYIILGWVWFVLPDTHSAIAFFTRLFV